MKKILILVLTILFIGIGTGIYYIYDTNFGIKYVFLFIGDGMGSNQVELTEIYNNYLENNLYTNQKKLSFSEFPNIGLRKNASNSSYVTDSAAAATVLASGVLTNNGLINKDKDLNNLRPITYDLKDKGFKIGIITNDSFNGATPAAFYANALSRNDTDIILEQLPQSNFEFFAASSLNNLEKDRTYYQGRFEYNGYIYQESNQNLSKGNKYILLNDDITENLRQAINVLDNKKGFFIMVEQAEIDHAGHDNIATDSIDRVNELNEAVKVALEFFNKHPRQTIIIVTGDHETGGLSLANRDTGYQLNLDVLKVLKENQDGLKSMLEKEDNLEEFLTKINNLFEFKEETIARVTDAYMNDKTTVMDIIKKEVYNQTGISYSSEYHSAARIPVYSIGRRTEELNGLYDSKEFNDKLKNILKIK